MANHKIDLAKAGKSGGRDTSVSLNGSVIEPETEAQKSLGRNNFIMMIIAGIMIVVGFLLMLGGSTTLEHYNESIFSTRRLIVGPTICFIGFIAMGVAIIIRPKKK